jgi:hypothetical protein
VAAIFISYSSRDKEFARKLATILIQHGHKPWLDDWEIKVGQSISSKIDQGLSSTDYVALVLTQHSVDSPWVDREWKAKYWDEVNRGRVTVLPLLVDDCQIPSLLKDKKYADFRADFDRGFVELLEAIDPAAQISSTALNINEQFSRTVGELLARAHSDELLSSLLIDVMQFARAQELKDLYNFCHGEIRGYHDETSTTEERAGARPYRVIEFFASKVGAINPDYFDFRTVSGLLDFLERNPDKFVPIRLIDSDGIAELESTARNATPASTAVHLEKLLGSINPGAPDPERIVHMYARPDSYWAVIQAIRRNLIQMLVALLPTM